MEQNNIPETSKPTMRPSSRLVWKVVPIIAAVVCIIGLIYYFLTNSSIPLITNSNSPLKLKAALETPLGVDPKSTFILTSKTDLNENSVKTHLQINPKIGFKTERINSKEIEIKPESPLAQNKIYSFSLTTEVENEAENRDFSWAFQTKTEFGVLNTLPRDKANGVPVNTGIEITMTNEQFNDYEKHFSISPKVEGRFEKHKRTIVFVPKSLQPRTIYTVTLSKGISVENGSEKTTNDTTFQFETNNDQQDNSSTYTFNSPLYEFPTAEKPALDIYAYGYYGGSVVKTRVYKYKDDLSFVNAINQKMKLPAWSIYANRAFKYSTNDLQKITEFDSSMQSGESTSYVIFPQQLSEGMYLVETQFGNEKAQAMLQMTDVAAYTSITENKSLIWLNEIQSKKPISKAKISIIDQNVSIPDTNDQGITEFKTPDSIKKNYTGNFIKATTPQNKSILIPVDNYGSRYYFQSYTGSRPSDKYWTYVYTDKELYLPTDTINIWGVIKDRDSLKGVSDLTMELSSSVYTDGVYKNSVAHKSSFSTSDEGSFINKISLGNIQPGYFSLEIKNSANEVLITKSISVETYSKPVYKVTVEPTKQAVFAGDTFEYKGKVQFFEGSATSNLRLKYNLYELGNNISGEITTDAQGQFTLPVQTQYQEKSSSGYTNYYPGNNSLSLSPFNAEQGEIYGYAAMQVFGPDIVIKSKTEVENDGVQVKLNLNNITLDKINSGTDKSYDDYYGTPVQDKSFTGKLNEIVWEKKDAGEFYDFISKTTQKKYNYTSTKKYLRDIELKTDAEGVATSKIQVPDETTYQLDIEILDSKGRKATNTVMLYGKNGARHDQYKYYYLTQAKDNSSKYALGEQLKLTLSYGDTALPSGSDNRYLFILAQRGIKDYTIQDKPDFSRDFKPEYIPSVQGIAVHFDGRTYHEASSNFLAYDSELKKLSIEVNSDAPRYKPGDKVNLDINVKDKDGVPKKAEVNVSLVDEALFDYSPQYVNILESLYSNIGAGIISTYASHQVPFDLGGGGGGGCFLPDTKITLADGSKKQIKDIKVGDKVQTLSDQNLKNKVTGKVLRVFKHQVGEYLVINNFLKVTPEHNLFVSGRWMTAGEVQVGNYLMNSAGEWVTVESIDYHKTGVEVYNLEIEKYHTFLADNIYVHNDKGRSLFVDTAFFGAVKTDDFGNAKINFNLPDNLTSWRSTVQSVTNDLYAGQGTKQIVVKLPFFIDAVLNTEYLTSDRPEMKLRFYGDGVQANQNVQYTVEIPSLNNQNLATQNAKTFEDIYYKLPELKEGTHNITISATSGQFKDKMTRKIYVYNSRIVKIENKSQKLADSTKIEIKSQAPVTLTFLNSKRAKAYSELIKIQNSFGDRADQQVARSLGSKIRREIFKEEMPPEEFEPTIYQDRTGGIMLLPYSSPETGLSAKIAAAGPELFDTVRLVDYFYTIADGAKSTNQEEYVMALSGLASLHEPVLVPIKTLINKKGTTVKESLYLALGLAKLGDKETARAILDSIISQRGETLSPNIRIREGIDQDDFLENTALAAATAGIVNHPQKVQLFGYLAENDTKDILVDLEKLIYIANSQVGTSTESKFSVTLNGKTEEIKLNNAETYSTVLAPADKDKITFGNISGDVDVITTARTPAADTSTPSQYVSLQRDYQPGANMKESDIVKISIRYAIKNQAVDGCYQITDYLPSGLKPVTNPYNLSMGTTDKNIRYPYEISGQRVSFCATKGDSGILSYYARVISKGEYMGEAPSIQSLKALDILSFGNKETISIK
jgi:hypothetical protein